MKVLVTGGAGFIGSHIADALITRGYEIDIVDNLSTGRIENVPAKARFYNCVFDSAEVKNLIQKNRYEVISHHAAQIDVRKSVVDPAGDVENDVAATVRLLQWAVESNVRHVVFASSGGAIYGEQQYFPADEKHPINPLSPYGLNKWFVEKYLQYYYRECGLGYTALRYANVYGPRQNYLSEAGVVAIFSHKLLHGEEAVINGSGEQTRDFLFIEDAVAANIAAIERYYCGALNIGTGIETSVNTIFAVIKELTGSPQTERHGPPKKGEQMRSVIAFRKAEQDLRWSPQVFIREGIKLTIQYFAHNKPQ